MKKICFITTSRADFGALNELIKEAVKKNFLLVQLIVSGNHFSKVFGKTEKEINKKNCLVKKIKVGCQNKDSKAVARSFSECVNKFSKTLYNLKPDIFVAFGDRYEMLAAVLSAYILRVPIAHIAGGEKTAGSIDEGFRHSISKLSSLHFPVMNIYKKRLIQLGENPKTIFNYGSLNHSKIKNNKYLTKLELEKKLKIKFDDKKLIITYHPDTIDNKKCIKNLSVILNSLKKIKKTTMIITSPNADAQGVLMIKYINRYIKSHKLKKFLFVKSLGSSVYLSLLRVVDGVVGNSSSGISEVPSFCIGTVNIGDRQQGRFMAPSVINCPVSKIAIVNSINKILNNNFKKRVKNEIKLNRNNNVAKKIIRRLLSFDFRKYNKKVFYDI